MVDLPETAASWASSQRRRSSTRGFVRRCRAWRRSSAARPRKLSELRIGAIAVDLQDAAESRKMLGRPRMFTVGGIDVGNARRSATGPRPLVARIGPELSFLDAP